MLLVEDRKLAVPFPLNVLEVDDKRVPFDVKAMIRPDFEKKHMVIDELSVRRRPGGPPVTAAAIGKLPLRDIVEAAIAETAMAYDPKSGVVDITGAPPRARGSVAKEFARPAPPRGKGGGRPDITDDDLAMVAALYRDAKKQRLRVNEYVAEYFGVRPHTADRAIARARKAGYDLPSRREDVK